MSDENKTSTPNEIPLHEVVLRIMFEANKNQPEKMTVSEVHRKVEDRTISEVQISQVLEWLAARREVLKSLDKYSLDRFSFIDERNKDFERQGIKPKLVADTPLHEIVLDAMFELSKNEPAKLTIDDIFWKIADPKVLRTHLSDVLNWLEHERRIEHISGKYSLHEIEFRDQQKAASTPKPALKKKPAAKKKTANKEESKTETPPVEAEKETPKAETPIVVEEKKEKKVKEPVVHEVKVEPSKPVPVAIPEEATANPIWRMPVLVLAILCAMYSFYLLYALNGAVSASANQPYADDIKQELVSVDSKLKEVSDKALVNKQDLSHLRDQLKHIEELTQSKKSIELDNDSKLRISSLVTRLTYALLLTFVFTSFLLFTAGKRASKK